jgi:diguanylate cyclase (GGDEF)-like protein
MYTGMTLSPLTSLTKGWEVGLSKAAWLRCTIRGRILLAFLVMSIITGALGGYAAISIEQAGVFVAKTFDESLMSINYARAASADFASMQAAVARRWLASDEAVRNKLDKEIEELERSLAEDLMIAAERSQSSRAAKAAASVQQAVKAWSDERQHSLLKTTPETSWEGLDRYAAIVAQQIDLLINYTAGDAFTYRQRARAAVAVQKQLDLAATVIALFLSAVVAWLLAQRIVGPVATASAVAERIAGGRLDGEIPKGSGLRELEALLAAMGVMRDNIREMMEREVALRRTAQARLADALQNSREGIVVVDAQGRIALVNSQAVDFFSSSADLLRVGIALPDHAPSVAGAEWHLAVLSHDPAMPATGEIHLKDGRWLRVSRSTTQDGGFIAVYSDITVLKDQEARLKATNLRLDAALDNMSQGLCLYDAENRLQVVNRRFCEIFMLAPAKVQPGITFHQVLELSVIAGNHGNRTAADLITEEEGFIHQRVTGTHFMEFRQDRVVSITRQPTSDGGWVATYEDVTERRRAEARIAFMARHDALTNLPNRVLFAERIEQALGQTGRGCGDFAVFCLDLDNFKQVNDTLGHPVGDELLRAVAERLEACIREVDTVGRLGGDEFAVLQYGIERPEDAAVLARRILEVVSAPYIIEGQKITVGVSIGISIAPSDGATCGKLLRNADVALYRAKADGRGTWRFFEAEMDIRLQARRQLELDLRDALANDEFVLFYQPIYDFENDWISGFEALVRWQHPTRGIILPSEFIPLAEEIGLIVPLGQWVLRTACIEATKWPKHVKVAVNVSATQFKSESLVPSVREALTVSGLAAQKLELEITESVLLANSSSTLDALHALRELGLRISMDDFGTGYSSLSYLRSFPFDKIKIDQSFIQTLAAKDGSRDIVRTIVGLGRSLGMRTTAEGVETLEQLALLRAVGCHEAQGYYFSVPVPEKNIPKLIEQWNGRRQSYVRGIVGQAFVADDLLT